MKVKIEKFEVLHGPILTSLIYCLFLTSGMKQFELQKSISQLFNALKSQYFDLNFFRWVAPNNWIKPIISEKKHFWDVITLELHWDFLAPRKHGGRVKKAEIRLDSSCTRCFRGRPTKASEKEGNWSSRVVLHYINFWKWKRSSQLWSNLSSYK